MSRIEGADTQAGGEPRGQRLWPLDALLVLLCCLAFGPGMPALLLRYDDPLYLMHNTVVLGRPGWPGLLAVWDSTRVWQGQFVEYFPLRDTVYWLLFQRWELWSLPYHLTTLGFHILASSLALRLALSLGLSRWAAAVAALLFAVHPIHIESVEWAAGLKDPMYTACVLGSLLAYARYRTGPRPWLLVVSLLLFVAGLLVKSMALSAPLLLLAMERLVGAPTSWKLIAQRLSGFLAIAGLFLVQFVLIGKANQVVLAPHGGTWATHAVLAGWAQLKYLKQALLPSTFRLIYCFEPPAGLWDVRLLAAVLALLAVGALFWWWRRQPLLRFGVVWYFVCLAPASNVVPFPAVMADRYLYAAVLGVCVVFALLLERLGDRVRSGVVGAVVLSLTLTTAARSTLWLNQENLWAETDEDPECLVDRSRRAVDAHLLRFMSAKDPRVALQALERGLSTPAAAEVPYLCESLRKGTLIALELGEPARGEGWAEAATAFCPYEADMWAALRDTTLHRKPAAALAAAERAWRLAPTAEAQALLGLLRIEQRQADGSRLLLDAVRRAPEEACPSLERWLVEAHGALGPVSEQAPQLAASVSWCSAHASPARLGP